MKKIACFVLVLLALSCTLYAGGGGQRAGAARQDKPTFDQLLAMNWNQIYDEAKKEGSVVYWSWDNEALWQLMGKAFEARYPGVRFEFVMSPQNAATSKVIAEKDGPVGSFDVMKIGGQNTKLTMDADVFLGPILQKMEAVNVLDKSLSVRQEGVEIKGYLVPIHRNQTGLLYNPAKVTNPPQSWADLEAWIDANPNKFAFCVPERGGSGQSFVHSAIKELTGGLDQYYGDDDVVESKVRNWNLVWDWINARKNRIGLTTSNNDSLSRMNAGEFDLVVAWDDNTLMNIAAGELFKDVVLYIPKFGMAGGGDTLGIPRNAPNPAASLLLVNWFTSVEGQKLLVEEAKAYPAREDVPTQYTLLKPADLVNKLAWIPAAYKNKFIMDFTLNVLQ